MFGAGFGAKLSSIGNVMRDDYDGQKQQQIDQQAQSFDLRQQLLQQQAILAQARAESANRDPDVIRSLRAAGIDPTSPQGQGIIASNYSHPIVLGSPEAGQAVVGGAFGTPSMSPPALSTPAIGTVMQGYRFNGGDPSQQSSWSKVP